MELWIKILAMALPCCGTIILLPIFLWCHRSRRLVPSIVNPQSMESSADAESQTHKSGLTKLNQVNLHHHHEIIKKESPFSWNDHPELITEAAENGWSPFAFTSWPSTSTAEFIQTVRLNPHGDDSISSLRMCLPLPGPAMDGCSFPREAYFEITILYLKLQQKQQRSASRASRRATASSAVEDDRVKLINDKSIEVHYDDSSHELSVISVIEEPKTIKEEERRVLISLGLTKRGSPPRNSLPGTYPGSAGFQGNGSVYLDGTKLAFESEKTQWAQANRVIGCGFDPGKKKVFFTVDSELVHVVHCTSNAYSAPLFPALAANTDVMVLVNLGQRRFKYEPANAYRTPNPCLRRWPSTSAVAAATGNGDNQEAFPMGRMNSEWLHGTKKSQSREKSMVKCDTSVDFEGDSDLFEIPLS